MQIERLHDSSLKNWCAVEHSYYFRNASGDSDGNLWSFTIQPRVRSIVEILNSIGNNACACRRVGAHKLIIAVVRLPPIFYRIRCSHADMKHYTGSFCNHHPAGAWEGRRGGRQQKSVVTGASACKICEKRTTTETGGWKHREGTRQRTLSWFRAKRLRPFSGALNACRCTPRFSRTLPD